LSELNRRSSHQRSWFGVVGRFIAVVYECGQPAQLVATILRSAGG
jgi:hypothetical protein